jgi:hypothetical protein
MNVWEAGGKSKGQDNESEKPRTVNPKTLKLRLQKRREG